MGVIASATAGIDAAGGLGIANTVPPALGQQMVLFAVFWEGCTLVAAPAGWTLQGNWVFGFRSHWVWTRAATAADVALPTYSIGLNAATAINLMLLTTDQADAPTISAGTGLGLSSTYYAFPALDEDAALVLALLSYTGGGGLAPLATINNPWNLNVSMQQRAVWAADQDAGAVLLVGANNTDGPSTGWLQLLWPPALTVSDDLVSLSTSESLGDRLVYPKVEVGVGADVELLKQPYRITDLFDDLMYTARPFDLSRDRSTSRYSFETQLARLERTKPTRPIIAETPAAAPEAALEVYLDRRNLEYPYLQYKPLPALRLRTAGGLVAPTLPLISIVPDQADPASLRDELLEFVAPFEGYVVRCDSEDDLEFVAPYWVLGVPTPVVSLTDDDIEGDYVESVGLRPEWNQATVTNRPWGYSENPEPIAATGAVRLDGWYAGNSAGWPGAGLPDWGEHPSRGATPSGVGVLLQKRVGQGLLFGASADWILDNSVAVGGGSMQVEIAALERWGYRFLGLNQPAVQSFFVLRDQPTDALRGTHGTVLATSVALATTGSINAGAKTLAVASAANLHVGTALTVAGAGDGGDLETYITAVSGTNLTLFHAAETTVVGAAVSFQFARPLPLDGQTHFLFSLVGPNNTDPNASGGATLLGAGVVSFVNVQGQYLAEKGVIRLSWDGMLSWTDALGKTALDRWMFTLNAYANRWGQLATSYTGRFGYSSADYASAPGLEAAQADGVFTAPALNIDKYTFAGDADATCLQIATGRVLAHYRPRTVVDFNLAPPYRLGPQHLNKLVALSNGKSGVLVSLEHNETHTPYTVASRKCRVEVLPETVQGQLLDTNGQPVLDTNGQPIYTTEVY